MTSKPQKPKPEEVLSGLRQLLLESEVNRVEGLLTEMLLLFYPPFRAEDDVELLNLAIVGARAYVEDLCEFTPEVLKAGWRAVRRAHKVERWPTPQVIRDACLDAAPKRREAVSDHQQERIRLYRATGIWLESWGARPIVGDAADAQHDRWMQRYFEGLSPEQADIATSILNRIRDGESAASVLDKLGDFVGRMPLHAGERLSALEAERRRQESLRRANGGRPE